MKIVTANNWLKPKFMYVFVGIVLVSFVGLAYFCPDKSCALTSRFEVPFISNNPDGLEGNFTKKGCSFDDLIKEDFSFDMDSRDVMVFLHMQKTGGTSFGKHLVHDLDLQNPCTCPVLKKRCYCFRPHSNQSWLFSRYTTGWKCGLHADWTELTNCVDEKLDELEGHVAKRRYFYVTLLREPIARYLSEYRHVQRGATWKNALHYCKGRPASEDEIIPCYKGESWEGVNLDEFMSCKSNLATNRQTRMLSDLELVDCYNLNNMSKFDRERVMLASAKRNLNSMAFFGLTEYQKISQYVFEETFNLRFAIPFEQNNATVSSHTLPTLTADETSQITSLNRLDVELYAYAKRILMKRFEKLKSRDPHFNQRFSHLGDLAHKLGITEFDWERFNEDSGTEKSREVLV